LLREPLNGPEQYWKGNPFDELKELIRKLQRAIKLNTDNDTDNSRDLRQDEGEGNGKILK
jgi:hypothetical protein